MNLVKTRVLRSLSPLSLMRLFKNGEMQTKCTQWLRRGCMLNVSRGSFGRAAVMADGGRCLFFIDSQGDLDALIKGYSSEEIMSCWRSLTLRIHFLGAAECHLRQTLQTSRLAESGKNSFVYSQDANGWTHPVLLVPESFKLWTKSHSAS